MNRREFLKNGAAVGLTGAWALSRGPTVGPRPVTPTGLPLRPPGALPESEFLARCIRCMRCVDNCPNQAIVALDDRYGASRRDTPAIQARRQACMLCNRLSGQWLKCTRACPTGALQPIRNDVDSIRAHVHMGTAEIDTALCYSYTGWSCGACYRACPLPGEAMTLGLWERPEVQPDHCVGCGACERACIRYPQAIRVKPRAET